MPCGPLPKSMLPTLPPCKKRRRRESKSLRMACSSPLTKYASTGLSRFTSRKRVRSVRCRWIDPDALSVFAAVDRPQGFSLARSRHALATFDQEQSAVGGTLHQAGAGIEKGIRLPFERHPAMGAPIGVHVDLTRSPHGQNP